jgi:hypothetical protein
LFASATYTSPPEVIVIPCAFANWPSLLPGAPTFVSGVPVESYRWITFADVVTHRLPVEGSTATPAAPVKEMHAVDGPVQLTALPDESYWRTQLPPAV